MTRPRPFGHYYILEKIAQGGMAEIFKGLTYDFSGLKKFVVIKRILPHISANQDFVRMLINEAKIAVTLNHGNIAQTFDLGKVAEDYFIVMEFVEGPTLSHIYKRSTKLEKQVPISIATYITSEICNGLDYMHRRTDENGNPLQIIHRDISPQNIIISSSGNVKIVDFGVAKAAFKLSEKEKGILKGKFAYMSPEQTRGDHLNFRSDIFSTGVVLWELLTGRRLFKRKSNAETLKAVKALTIYPPSAYRKEVSPDLDEIVLCALERNPENRFQSAADISLKLTKFLLKHDQDFKPVQVNDYLKEIFPEESISDSLDQEKTLAEEASSLAANGGSSTPEFLPPSSGEDTLLVDPKELDFHSIFHDIDVEEEVSEVTRAITLTEVAEKEPETVRGEPEEEETRALSETTHVEYEEESIPGLRLSDLMRRRWLILGLGGGFLLSLFLLAYWLSH